MRILIAEDHINLRVFMKLVLEVKGFQPIVVNDAAEAMAVEKVDLLIANLNLPDTNAIALSQRLRAKHPDCKTLIISGQPPDKYDLSAIDGWLEKPFSTDQLVQSVVDLTVVPA